MKIREPILQGYSKHEIRHGYMRLRYRTAQCSPEHHQLKDHLQEDSAYRSTVVSDFTIELKIEPEFFTFFVIRSITWE